MKIIRDRILWWAALRRIKKHGSKVIAIGGAIAKTSTKTAIGAVLNAAYPGQVRIGYGNLNTYIGVPLAILDFKIDFHEQKVGLWQWLKILTTTLWRGFFLRLPKYLVLEYSTDSPDDVKAIAQKLPPDIGVITIVGPAHLANYPSVAAMAEDEGWLAQATKKDGVLFVNSSDPYLTNHHSRARAQVVNVVCELEQIAWKFAEAVGHNLQIDDSTIEQARKDYHAPNRRFNYEQVGGMALLDDSYNASPLAVKAALHLLKRMEGRHVAILGSMLELGDLSAKYHQEIGQYAKGYADLIIAVGAEAKEYGAKIWFASADEAAGRIFDYLKEGDSILVKGSKSVHMEAITKAIREHQL